MSLNPSRSRKVVVTLWHKVENKEDYSTVLEFGEEDGANLLLNALPPRLLS